MARGVNKVILIGNLGKDPEVRYMPSGGAVAEMTLATSETWKDKATGDRQERTEWHNLTFFGRQAEIAGEYLRKGSRIYIEGSLRTDKWQDKNGNDRYTTKVIVREFQMLDSRNGDSDAPGQARGRRGDSGPRTATGRDDQPAAPDFDDDIPF